MKKASLLSLGLWGLLLFLDGCQPQPQPQPGQNQVEYVEWHGPGWYYGRWFYAESDYAVWRRTNRRYNYYHDNHPKPPPPNPPPPPPPGSTRHRH